MRLSECWTAVGDGARGRVCIPGCQSSSPAGRGPLSATTVIASSVFGEKINTKEISMDLMEITEKERLSREQAAARLHALADALARHNEVEFERGGLRFTVHVPDEVNFKLEIEIGEDGRELEVELTW
jgi:amphi-Trp domain-containing protein